MKRNRHSSLVLWGAYTCQQMQALYQALRGDSVAGLLDALRWPGINVNGTYSNGLTPLMIAVRKQNARFVEILLDAGADPNLPVKKKGVINEEMPICYAATYETLQLLVSRGADVNVEDGHGFTPLTQMAYWGDVRSVRYLFDAGADPHFGLPFGDREEELNHPRKNAKASIFMVAVDHLPVLEYLATRSELDIDRRGFSGHTGLTFAALCGKKAAVEFLVAHGADVNFITYGDWTATPLSYARKHPEIVRFLLQNGADPNLRSPKRRMTPLHFCYDCPKTIEILLEYGANPTLRDNRGRTPLHLICEKYPKGEAAIRLLYDVTPRPYRPPIVNCPALDRVISNIEGGKAVVRHLDKAGLSPLVLQYLWTPPVQTVQVTHEPARAPDPEWSSAEEEEEEEEDVQLQQIQQEIQQLQQELLQAAAAAPAAEPEEEDGHYYPRLAFLQRLIWGFLSPG
jgi:ankyrin repeat protein